MNKSKKNQMVNTEANEMVNSEVQAMDVILKSLGNENAKKKKSAKDAIKALTLMELCVKIVEETNDAEEIITKKSKPYAEELASRTGLTPVAASLLAVFIDQSSDRHIVYNDLARHFDVRTIRMMAIDSAFGELIKASFIKRRDRDNDKTSFFVPNNVVKALTKNQLPEPPVINGLDADEFLDLICKTMDELGEETIEEEECIEKINEIIDKNQQLLVAQKLKGLGLNNYNLILYLLTSRFYIYNHDEQVGGSDIDDYFNRGTMHRIMREMKEGISVLMKALLVEHTCRDGVVDTNHWCITQYSRNEIFAEYKLDQQASMRSNLTHHEDIIEKQLFYNEETSQQVGKFHALLEPEKMGRVLERMEKKGLRKGFACIFYGAPGTGKTETVMQLARQTGRDIMVVDVPSIRSKWVGETEQNIKAVFDRYRRAVKANEVAPILLFNEADALLNKRNEGGVHSVDKMENTMQNIILQEMENLEGVMIATTNLAGNLDDAFERRFLYKVQFDKPEPEQRANIWKAMLTDLTDEQAMQLAYQFDFSGGQIENIARKRIVDDIIEEHDELDFDSIVDNCKHELLNSKSKTRIGF